MKYCNEWLNKLIIFFSDAVNKFVSLTDKVSGGIIYHKGNNLRKKLQNNDCLQRFKAKLRWKLMTLYNKPDVLENIASTRVTAY